MEEMHQVAGKERERERERGREREREIVIEGFVWVQILHGKPWLTLQLETLSYLSFVSVTLSVLSQIELTELTGGLRAT